MKHVILGNGPAGVIAAETIRKQRAEDDIVLVGDEPEPPYSRMAIPYLLMGNIGEEGTYLRKDKDHFARQRIELRTGRAASGGCWTRAAYGSMTGRCFRSIAC